MQPATRYLVISGVLIVSLTSTAALLAIWSALSRRNRLLRAAVFFALPSAFLYAQAAEPAIGLFVEMVTICGALLVVRWLRRDDNASNESVRRKLQFHFRDVLFGIALIGVVLAGELRAQKQLYPPADFTSFLRYHYFPLLECAGLAVVSLASVWSAFGVKRGWLRLGVLAATVPIVHYLMRGLAFVTEHVSGLMFGTFVVWEGDYELNPVAVYGGLAAVVVAYLGIWRYVVGNPCALPDGSTNTIGANETRTNSRRLRKTASIVTLGVVSLIVAVPAAYLYYELVRPIAIPPDEVPSPNGWDQLIAAGGAVQFPPGVMMTEETPAQLAVVVQQNQQVLADARRALAFPSRVRVSYADWPKIDDSWSLRHLSWIVDDLGKFHTQNERWDDALGTYKDLLRLADCAERGGLVGDMLTGSGIVGTSVMRLASIAQKLTVAQSRALIRDLLDYEREREPLSVIVERDKLTTRTRGKWVGRWIECVETLVGHPGRKLYPDVRRRSSAAIRVLVCDLALHAYWLDHGALPRDAGELVPGYLAEIPRDPWDERPIKLVFRDGEYLVYSVGPNGRDDGGTPDRDTGDWPVTERKLAEEKK